MSRTAAAYRLSTSDLMEDIGVDQLRRGELQLRKDLGDLTSLMVSISDKGLLYPLLVRPFGDVFEVVCGNRRFEACKKLRIKSIKCIICHFSDKKAFEVSLTENLQRQSLDPMEEARAFKRYVLESGWGSVTKLARRIGKSEEYVSHKLLLLDLPDEVLSKVSDKSISPSKARELIWLKDPKLQKEVSDAVISHNLCVRSEHELIKLVRNGFSVHTALQAVVEEKRSEQSENSESAYTDSDLNSSILVLEKSIVVLRLAMIKMDTIIEHSHPNEVRQFLIQKRFQLHQMLDESMRMRKSA